MRRLAKQILIVLVLIYFGSMVAAPSQAQDPRPFANCRLGAAGLNSNLEGFDLQQLNLGLYSDWGSGAPPAGLPANVEYIQTVRVHQDKVGSSWYGGGPYVDPPAYTVWPNLATLATLAASSPGSLWLIGNEIERVDWQQEDGSYSGQDEITPELYATAFHEIRNVIKTADPTAQIAIGGVIQATPLRLKYLDRVWDSYWTQYGYSMGQDIDVWNIHGFMLQEVRDGGGAEIPAGLADNYGFLAEYDVRTFAGYQAILAAHHDMDYYRQFIEALRSWMAAHGEQNKPLINTEYGILLNIGSTQQVIDYMTATLDYMLTTTDETIGYPADQYRLVQGWVWLGVDADTSWFPYGTLFNSTTKNLTTVGEAWKSYVTDPSHPLASQPQPNLLVTNLKADPGLAFVSPGESVNVTLMVDVANSGNVATYTANQIMVKFWDGPPHASGSSQIGTTQILKDIPGCGRGRQRVAIEWPNRGQGDYTWYVEVVPLDGETKVVDNTAATTFRVIEGEPVLSYLPIIRRR